MKNRLTNALLKASIIVFPLFILTRSYAQNPSGNGVVVVDINDLDTSTGKIKKNLLTLQLEDEDISKAKIIVKGIPKALMSDIELSLNEKVYSSDKEEPDGDNVKLEFKVSSVINTFRPEKKESIIFLLNYKGPDDSFRKKFHNIPEKITFLVNWKKETIELNISDLEFIPRLPTFDGKDTVHWPFIHENNQWPDYIFALDLKSGLSKVKTYKYQENSDIKINGETYKFKEKKISPQVGKHMSVIIRGVRTKYDSVVYQGTFSSNFLESQNTFASFGVEKKDEGEAKGVAKIEKEAIEAASGEEKKNMVGKLKRDYQRYYSYIQKFSLDEITLKADRDFINQQLTAAFDITDFKAKLIGDRLKESISPIEADEDIDEIIGLYNSIMSYSSITFLPEQIEDQDELKLNFDFYKGGKKRNAKSYTYPTSLGFKIDFSSGFVYSRLTDRAFKIVNADNSEIRIDSVKQNNTLIKVDTLTKKVIEDDIGDFKIGVALLSHYYTRTGSFANIGGTAGFTINSDADIQYLAGFSMMFQSLSRLVVSAGWTFGRVDRLSTEYTLNEPMAESFFTNINDSDLTTKKWDNNFFFSITYNFGNINPGKDKKEGN